MGLISIFDMYILGGCGALLVLYFLLVWFDKGETK